MWHLDKGDSFLPETSIKSLKQFYKMEKNSKAKLRLLAALHRKKGKSIDSIAGILEKPRKTIHGWLTYFQERGISGKDSIQQTGKPPKLTNKQRKDFIRRLEKGPPQNPNGLWTAKETRSLIYNKYGILYGRTNMWKILIASGFTPQVPRKKHYKSASIEEIEAFKKRLDEKQGTTKRKILLWPQKMKQRLA